MVIASPIPFAPSGEFTNLPASYQQSLEDYLVALGTVTAAAYPEGGLGRIVVGGGIDENVLTIEKAAIVTRRNGGDGGFLRIGRGSVHHLSAP